MLKRLNRSTAVCDVDSGGGQWTTYQGTPIVRGEWAILRAPHATWPFVEILWPLIQKSFPPLALSPFPGIDSTVLSSAPLRLSAEHIRLGLLPLVFHYFSVFRLHSLDSAGYKSAFERTQIITYRSVPYTWSEVTSQNLWSQNDHHFVGIKKRMQSSIRIKLNQLI